ncbi:hypothetical protein E2C01_081412 [Portunus trituberculatus]|uniref:Uncharacterized protein n=1 Tax=Portunus trituberculatus TaxID=210409 RepID=A0A5B7IWK6_PORTR|nr:hypothetical protein [Portunus trituberculatus]
MPRQQVSNASQSLLRALSCRSRREVPQCGGIPWNAFRSGKGYSTPAMPADIRQRKETAVMEKKKK